MLQGSLRCVAIDEGVTFGPTCSLCIPVPSTHAIRTDVDGRPRVVALQLAAVFNLDSPGTYLHWGFIQISLANFLVIVVMVIVFFAAILIPMKRHHKEGEQ